jgi:hypothetical protein
MHNAIRPSRPRGRITMSAGRGSLAIPRQRWARGLPVQSGKPIGRSYRSYSPYSCSGFLHFLRSYVFGLRSSFFRLPAQSGIPRAFSQTPKIHPVELSETFRGRIFQRSSYAPNEGTLGTVCDLCNGCDAIIKEMLRRLEQQDGLGTRH